MGVKTGYPSREWLPVAETPAEVIDEELRFCGGKPNFMRALGNELKQMYKGSLLVKSSNREFLLLALSRVVSGQLPNTQEGQTIARSAQAAYSLSSFLAAHAETYRLETEERQAILGLDYGHSRPVADEEGVLTVDYDEAFAWEAWVNNLTLDLPSDTTSSLVVAAETCFFADGPLRDSLRADFIKGYVYTRFLVQTSYENLCT